MTVTRCYCDDCQQSTLDVLMAARVLRVIEAQEASVVHGRDDGDFGDDGTDSDSDERTVTRNGT